MARKNVFELGGARAIAEMHDDDVPKTCDAVWNILPVEGMSIHANWVGREIMLHLEGEKVLRLPPEGPRTRGTARGDIGYFAIQSTTIRWPTSAGRLWPDRPSGTARCVGRYSISSVLSGPT